MTLTCVRKPPAWDLSCPPVAFHLARPPASAGSEAECEAVEEPVSPGLASLSPHEMGEYVDQIPLFLLKCVVLGREATRGGSHGVRKRRIFVNIAQDCSCRSRKRGHVAVFDGRRKGWMK